MLERLIITLFYKNKLYENNEAEIGSKNKSKLKTFWGSEVLKLKTKIKIIYISFKSLYLQKNDLKTKAIIYM